jgi:hypothetical protein
MKVTLTTTNAASYRAIVRAVQTGSLPEAHDAEAVARVLRYCLHLPASCVLEYGVDDGDLIVVHEDQPFRTRLAASSNLLFVETESPRVDSASKRVKCT